MRTPFASAPPDASPAINSTKVTQAKIVRHTNQIRSEAYIVFVLYKTHNAKAGIHPSNALYLWRTFDALCHYYLIHKLSQPKKSYASPAAIGHLWPNLCYDLCAIDW